MNDRMDKVGRIVIPKWIRRECDLLAGAKLEFIPLPESQSVLVRKGDLDFCIRCGSTNNLVELNEDSFLCRDCLQKLLSKDQA